MLIAADGLVAESEKFRNLKDGASVLDNLEERFRTFGATHFLVTGLPLPGRPIEPLVLRLDWGDLQSDRTHGWRLDANDPILQMALQARRAFVRFERKDSDRMADNSALVRLVGPPSQVRLIGVPVHSFPPYQGCVVAAGVGLTIDTKPLTAIDHYCTEAFQRLIDLGAIRLGRPGDLSARERKVVELSAAGKTASEIAEYLRISQRTVHAHLQNASEKMRANNKTHTVVEALRYGQISV